MKEILDVRGLSCVFNLGGERVRAVSDVSFKMYEGEIFGIVGESGSGKTTLLRMIVGIYEAYLGEVYFFGEKIRQGTDGMYDELRELDRRGRVEFFDLLPKIFSSKEKREEAVFHAKNVNYDLQKQRNTLRERLRTARTEGIRNRLAHPDIQMIFQDPTASLNPRMTVGEIVAEGLIIKGGYTSDEIDALVDEMLLSVGISPLYKSRYPAEFSGGQKQRIGIARALIMKPKLVIADEPVSALDVSVGADIINLLLDMRERLLLSVLFIAHDLSVVRHVTDRVGVMYHGRLVELGRTEDIYNNPIHPYTKSLLSAMPYPDPIFEKGRVRPTYDVKETSGGELREVEDGHFVLSEDV